MIETISPDPSSALLCSVVSAVSPWRSISTSMPLSSKNTCRSCRESFARSTRSGTSRWKERVCSVTGPARRKPTPTSVVKNATYTAMTANERGMLPRCTKETTGFRMSAMTAATTKMSRTVPAARATMYSAMIESGSRTSWTQRGTTTGATYGTAPPAAGGLGSTRAATSVSSAIAGSMPDG